MQQARGRWADRSLCSSPPRDSREKSFSGIPTVFPGLGLLGPASFQFRELPLDLALRLPPGSNISLQQIQSCRACDTCSLAIKCQTARQALPRAISVLAARLSDSFLNPGRGHCTGMYAGCLGFDGEMLGSSYAGIHAGLHDVAWIPSPDQLCRRSHAILGCLAAFMGM